MHFDLRFPCMGCPFRTDIPVFLRLVRVQVLLTEILDEEKTFVCHKTADMPERMQQQCAGAILLIEKERPVYGHRLLQIAERFGLYDPSILNRTAPVYETREAMIERHRREGG